MSLFCHSYLKINNFLFISCYLISFSTCMSAAHPHWHSLDIFVWDIIFILSQQHGNACHSKGSQNSEYSIVLFWFLVIAEGKYHLVPKIPICSPESFHFPDHILLLIKIMLVLLFIRLLIHSSWKLPEQFLRT